jgi:Uma2 family endonuclease
MPIRTSRGAASRRNPNPTGAVYYPESDGKPLAETQLHGEEIVRLTETLRDFYAEQPDVYVWMNMLMYFEEGNPRASVAPDVFVVKGVPKEPRRRIFKVWEEGTAPAVVFEVTSPSTRREDMMRKRDVYARLGVREYYLYDPYGEYLRPPLQGYRLESGTYQPLEPDAAGRLVSAELDLHLTLADGRMRLTDRQTGAELLDPTARAAIAESRASEAESRASEAESLAARELEARRQAEARIAELEARLRELEAR